MKERGMKWTNGRRWLLGLVIPMILSATWAHMQSVGSDRDWYPLVFAMHFCYAAAPTFAAALLITAVLNFTLCARSEIKSDKKPDYEMDESDYPDFLESDPIAKHLSAGERQRRYIEWKIEQNEE